MSEGINAVLAESGHRILCADLSEKAVEEAASRISDKGGDAHAYKLDVTDDDSIERLKQEIIQAHGGIDVLVNAAGLLDRTYLNELKTQDFEKVINVNLSGPFRLIKAFSPQMVEQGWGRIINISSIAGVTGYPYPSYAASKAGLSNLTRSLLIDLWGSGVTINSVCPGVVDTTMVVQAVRDQVANKVPTEQIINPREIGGFIDFLLTDHARNINGADLMIDGGATQVFRLFDDR